MKNARITKELLMYNNKPLDLYYSEYLDMYITENFAIDAILCDIDSDIIIQKLDESCALEDKVDQFLNMWKNYDKWNTVKIEHSENLTRLDNDNYSVVLPYLYYKNILEPLNSDVWSSKDYSFNNKTPLLIVDEILLGVIMPEKYLIEANIEKDIIQDDTHTNTDIEDNIIFKDVTPFFNGISRVIYNDFCAKLDTNGNIIQKIKCEDCWFYEEYTKVKINGKWGVLDLSNNIIITPQYEELFYYKNDFWEISINNKKGIIDTVGNIILPTIYNELDFINDTHVLAVKDSKYGVVDFRGKIIIPFHYDKLVFLNLKRKDFYFYATKNHTMGIIDINNNIIIPFIYKKLVYLNKNTIAAKIGKNKFILINEKNEQICTQIFENIHDNYDDIDIYPAQLNGLWGFIDEFGNKKIDFKYTDATKFKNGYCDVSIKKNPCGYNDYGLINKEGTLVLDYQYDINCTYVIDDDRFIVEQDSETFIIDKKGNVIVDKIYNWIIPLIENNFLPVTLDDTHKGFIDRDGKPLKINKKTLDIPITPINYDNLSQVDKISVLFNGQKL